MLSCVSLIVIG